MTCLDSFFTRRYNRETYNCAHFACEVWEELTGQNIETELAGFLRPPKDRRTDPALRRTFRKLNTPESPCLVLMQRRGSVPHAGVYVRGKVIHIHENGVEFLPVQIASRGFEKLGFYKC
jgi:hypothetical protein